MKRIVPIFVIAFLAVLGSTSFAAQEASAPPPPPAPTAPRPTVGGGVNKPWGSLWALASADPVGVVSKQS